MITQYTPIEPSVVGLAQFTLIDLGRVVILAGANGSGKSRILKCLAQDVLSVQASAQQLDTQRTFAEQLKSVRARQPDHPEVVKIENTIRQLERDCKHLESDSPLSELEVLELQLDGSQGMSSPKSAGPGQLVEVAEQMAVNDLNNVYAEAGKYLAYCANVTFNASHQDYSKDTSLREKADDVAKFSSLLESVAGTRVEVDVAAGHPQPMVFGRVFNSEELSAGQRRLLAWTISLHCQGATRLNGSVILIDEPETELHPASCSEVLARLREAVGPTGQLWISTHSPSVVAQFLSEGSVYHVEAGEPRFATNDPSKVMGGLFGGEVPRAQFYDFLAGAEAISMLCYAAKCLESPSIAGHTAGDRQGEQLLSMLNGSRTGEPRLRLLDYGAGKSRFAAALAESEVSKRVDYFAFNAPQFDDYAAEALDNISRLHPVGAQDHRSSDISDFRAEKTKCDVVLMCNFLHELSSDEWVIAVREAESVLREGGVLLIMEDQEPPVGELPHAKGFLLMQLGEVRHLFGNSADVVSLSVADERLSAIVVPKSELLAASTQTVRVATSAIQVRALRKLKEIRQSERSDHRAGRLHALYAMLYANASLALGINAALEEESE